MKFKKIKFKDLENDWFMLIRRPTNEDDEVNEDVKNMYYVILRFDRTFLHHHKFVRLLNVNKYYKHHMFEIKMFEEEFDENKFELVFNANKI